MISPTRPVRVAPLVTALLVVLVAVACVGTQPAGSAAPSDAIPTGAPAPTDAAPGASTRASRRRSPSASRWACGPTSAGSRPSPPTRRRPRTGACPLLPFESAELERRQTGEGELVGVVQQHLAEHADVSGGLYIDQARGGIVTMLVTDDPAPHEAALAAILGPDAVAVRQVRWTERELNDLQDRR